MRLTLKVAVAGVVVWLSDTRSHVAAGSFVITRFETVGPLETMLKLYASGEAGPELCEKSIELSPFPPLNTGNVLLQSITLAAATASGFVWTKAGRGGA